MPRAGELIVRLKQAKGIKGDEAFGFTKADLYANLSLGREKRTSNVVIGGGSDAVWNEEFRFKIAAHVNIGLYESLRIFIYHRDYYDDIRRGTAKIDVKNMLEEHEDEVPNREYPVIFHGQKMGGLVVGFTFKPVNGVPVVEDGLTTFDRGYRPPKKYAILGPQPLFRECLGTMRKQKISWKAGHELTIEEKEEQEKEEEAYSMEHHEAYSMEHEEEKHTEWASESESEYESVQSPPGKERTADGCSVR